MADPAPTNPATGPNPKPESVPRQPLLSWSRLTKRARTISQITALFAALIIGGGVVGYILGISKAPKNPPTAPTVTSLSPSDLNKLGQVGTDLGSSGQVLNIGADTLFRGKVNVSGNLSIGGQLNANGPVTLSALNIAGASGTTGLNVGTNLVVGGTAIFQKSLTVSDLATIGNLSVAGSASVGSLNANSIAVRSLSISGPLTIGHLQTQGPAPSIAAGSAGAGGTVSISGNDTAGTVNINTGTSPGNTLATITFRAAFSGNVHVILSPLTDAAATCGYYVTRTGSSFQIHAHTPTGGQVLSFDYLVVQ